MFSTAELEFLAGQVIGRISTLGPSGAPQVRPVGFHVRDDVIEIGGVNLASTQKYRNIERDGRVSFIVDDLASTDPWRPRGVEIRGRAEAAGDAIRIHPELIISWGLESPGNVPLSRRVR